MSILGAQFYEQDDVLEVARALLGKVLCTNVKGETATGIIIETEAYNGEMDRASHAFGGRRTARTQTMYGKGGTAYVYLCYGVHSMFNVVTGDRNVPKAVLIRGILPLTGIPVIMKRRSSSGDASKLCNGPGKVCSALGIDYRVHDGIDLNGNTVWIEDRGIRVPSSLVMTGPRIGVDYAGPDALLPYRFVVTQPQRLAQVSLAD